MVIDPDHRTPFNGFPEAGFAFLRELAMKQDKSWFQEHRHIFVTDVEAPMLR